MNKTLADIMNESYGHYYWWAYNTVGFHNYEWIM